MLHNLFALKWFATTISRMWSLFYINGMFVNKWGKLSFTKIGVAYWAVVVHLTLNILKWKTVATCAVTLLWNLCWLTYSIFFKIILTEIFSLNENFYLQNYDMIYKNCGNRFCISLTLVLFKFINVSFFLWYIWGF